MINNYLQIIMNNKIQKGQNQEPLLRRQEPKQGIVHEPCTQHLQRGLQTS